MEHYDAIIIGSGQAGNPLAVKLAVTGQKVALVENQHIGGSCVNVGCSPTKTMEASGRVAYLARRAADYGVNFPGPVTVNMDTVRQRKRAIVESFSGGDRAKLERKGVEVIMGQASFISPGKIEVSRLGGGTLQISADRIFIDTGTRPAVPEIEGLNQCSILDNESIMELGEVPEHLMVVGGGYVGLEFGRMFQRFGSKVTIIHRGKHVLSREDMDVAEAIQEIFTSDGIRVILQANTHHATQGPDGTIHLQLTCPGGEETVSGSHLLVATGRVPNTDMLNLSSAGIKTDGSGFIITNSRLETNVDGVWALGDVKGGPAFTHIAYDDYRVVKTNLLEGGNSSIDGRIMPYVVFIDPQLGRVGLTEEQAAKLKVKYKAVSMPMAHVARALEMDETRGFMKALVDPESGKILGFSCLGVEGGELMAAVQVAMMGNVTYRELASGIFAHPTLAESLNNLFGLVDRPL
jgi:pyruvate/2-oxoglutarate dehydrogenase complex dihydrolipoamide dehydrogenase (E3) component